MRMEESEGKESHPVPASLYCQFCWFLLESDSSSQPVLSSGDCIYNVASIWSPELGPVPVQSDSQRQARYQSQSSLAAQT